jgi:hypothetical protein
LVGTCASRSLDALVLSQAIINAMVACTDDNLRKQVNKHIDTYVFIHNHKFVKTWTYIYTYISIHTYIRDDTYSIVYEGIDLNEELFRLIWASLSDVPIEATDQR